MEPAIEDLFVEEVMQKALNAAHAFAKFDQEMTDRIVKAVYETGFNNRYKLADMAYHETGIGNVRDKTIKNIIATRFVYRDIRDQKTVGVISHDKEKNITEIVRPMGPVFAVTPVTNPTSTALFKIDLPGRLISFVCLFESCASEMRSSRCQCAWGCGHPWLHPLRG